MSNYRRAREGNTFFFTVVTHGRQPLLCLEESRAALKEVIKETQARMRFGINAWVLLPDHIHCIWTLPAGDSDYSKRWGLIKAGYTKRIGKALAGKAQAENASRLKHREQLVWQRRFWEHLIRDEKDFAAHCDYIHYNPVKHGLVNAARDWEYSSFGSYVEQGIYSDGWGSSDKIEFTADTGSE